MIKKCSLTVLEKAINFALRLDESMAMKLDAFESKIIEIIIKPLDVSFFIAFREQQVKLLDSYIGKPDATIQSSPLGLIKLSFLPVSEARSLFNAQVRLSGDTHLAQQVKQVFSTLDIDWEGHLATFTGDVVAYQLGSIFRKGRRFTQQVHESLRFNVGDYLEEKFPPPEEVDDFFQAVDTLSEDVERLQAAYTLMVSHEND